MAVSVQELKTRMAQLRGRLAGERQDLESARSVVRALNAQKLRGLEISETELKAQTESTRTIRARVESLENEIETLELAIEQEIEAQLRTDLAKDDAEAAEDDATKKKLGSEIATHLAALGKALARAGCVRLTGSGASDPYSWIGELCSSVGRIQLSNRTPSEDWIDMARLDELITDLRDSAWIDKAQFLRDRAEKREQRAREAKRRASGKPEPPRRRMSAMKALSMAEAEDL